MQVPDLSDQDLVALYEEAISEIDVEDLEQIGRYWADSFANGLREVCLKIATDACQKHGIPAQDVGKLLVLNGLSVMAVLKYREEKGL